MSDQVLADSYLAYPEELGIFQKPIQCIGVEKVHKIISYPINNYTNQGVIQFSIPANGSHYLDLKNIIMHVTCKIVKKDGTKLSAPKTNGGGVGVINNFFHSMFSRVDVSLQNKVLSHSDLSYGYLAYIRNLLENTESAKYKLQMQMYYPDTAASIDTMHSSTPSVTDNAGLKARSKFFNESREVEMCGKLASDVLSISRYIPNGVALDIKLHCATPSFCLMSADSDAATTGGYKFVITKAYLEVPKIQLSPEVLVAHSEVLANTPAVFPYTKYEIKKHTISKGSHSGEVNNPFQGRIPSELILGIVSDTAQHGSWGKNPLCFETLN